MASIQLHAQEAIIQFLLKKTIIKTTPSVRYQISSNLASSRGISTIQGTSQDPNLVDNDGYSELSASFQAAREINSKYKTDVVLKYKDRRLEYDDFSMAEQRPIEDPNAEAELRHFVGKAKITAEFFPKIFQSSFSFQHSIWNRKYKLNPDQTDFYRSHLQKFLLLNHVRSAIYATSTLGIDYERETMHSNTITRQSTNSLGASIASSYRSVRVFYLSP